MDLTGVRPFIGIPFALAGLVLGIVGCTGPRRGKWLAALAVAIAALGLAAEFIMIVGAARP
ncbi:hypothetical protein ACFYTQ_05255 [Nocardia sp. NPDC004068]|uniref:hypothetical protein n=1 Tax=Nocardia sp. NPDC004068 TaxID=3364303 RepID=UPI0036B681BB